jgi:hypothetical protein
MVVGGAAGVLLLMPFWVLLGAWGATPTPAAGAAEVVDWRISAAGAGAFPSKKPAGTAGIFGSTAGFASVAALTGFISAGGADVAVRAALRAFICEVEGIREGAHVVHSYLRLPDSIFVAVLAWLLPS